MNTKKKKRRKPSREFKKNKTINKNNQNKIATKRNTSENQNEQMEKSISIYLNINQVCLIVANNCM